MVITLLTVGGPGGCSNPGECKQYCTNDENKEECLVFAKEHNLLSQERLQKIEEHRVRIDEKLEGRTGPGECASREECRLYCADPEHAEECIAFGQDEGLIDRERAERSLRMLRDGEFDEYRARFEERRGEFEGRLEEERQRHGDFRTDIRQRLESVDGFEGTDVQRERLRQELQDRDTRTRYEYEQRLRDGSVEIRERFEERREDESSGSNTGSGSIIQFLAALLGL